MISLTEPIASESALSRIEKRTRQYADVRADLSALMAEITDRLNAVTRENLPLLKKLVARAAEKHADLTAALNAAPQLFEKPRTMVLHGIKVGFRKNEGRIEFDDPDDVVERIQEFLDDPEPYLRTVIQPNKEALAALNGADLKRLGCRVVETSDSVVIKPVGDDIDKKITAFQRAAGLSPADVT